MNIDLAGVSEGDLVELVPEPDNPVDPRAVQVWETTPVDDHPEAIRLLGYLPKDLAARLHHEAAAWRAIVAEVLTFEGRNSGLRVQLFPHDQDPDPRVMERELRRRAEAEPRRGRFWADDGLGDWGGYGSY